MPSLRRVAPPVFKQQPDATIDQANPVSGTKYEVLAETKNVRIIGISVRCTWTVQPDPLEIWVTADGQTQRWYVPSPASIKDYIAMTPASSVVSHTNLSMVEWSASMFFGAFLLEGRSVKVEAEITGGTVSNLSARVKWAKME